MAIQVLIYKDDIEYDITSVVSLPLNLTQTIDESLDSGSLNIPVVDNYLYLWDKGEVLSTTKQVTPIKDDRYFDEEELKLYTFNGFSWYGVTVSLQTYNPTADDQYWYNSITNTLYTSYSFDFSERIERLSRVVVFKDNSAFRYLVSEDKVDIIKKTIPTMYSHRVTLIEPTKLLERRVIPNMSVTQPTGSTKFYTSSSKIENYEIIGSLDDGNDANKQTLTLTNVNQSEDTAILDNNTLKELGETYNVGIDFKLWNDHYSDNYQDNYALIEICINGSSYKLWFDSVPGRTITHKRYVYGSINYNRTTLSSDEVVTIKVSQLDPEAGLHGNIHIEYLNMNIATGRSTVREQTFLDETVDKILHISKVSDMNDDTFEQEFVLGEYTRGKINKTINPELTFQRYTEWDSLKEISNIVKGIPRIGNTRGSTDPWKTVEFDFVDELDDSLPIYDISNYTNLTKNAYLKDYVNGLKIDADNVVEIQSSINKKSEPYYNGWMSLRGNDKGPVELRDNNFGLKLNQKIYKISKVLVKGIPVNVTDGTNLGSSKVWDITEHVYESKAYTALDDLDFTTLENRQIGTRFRGNCLYYSQSDNKILGFNKIAKYEKTIINNKIPERALYEAVYTVAQKYLEDNSLAGTVDDTTNTSVQKFAGVLFNVEYIPLQSLAATVMSQDARSFDVESVRYMNESAQVVDSDNIGEYAKALVNKLGNEIKTYTGFSDDIDSVPKIGQFLSTGEIVTTRTMSIEKNVISWSIDAYKDFSTISEFIGVDSKYRQWEVPDQDIVFRQDTYRDYLVLDKVDRLTDHNIYTSNALKLLFHNFVDDATPDTYTPISYGALKTREDILNPGDSGWTTFDKQVDMTINTTNVGTTLVISGEMEDNYSAGPKSVAGITDIDTDGNLIANIADYEDAQYQQDVRYTSDYGQFDSARIQLYTYGDDVITYSETLQYPEFRSLNSIDGINVSNIDVRLMKDSRERLGWNQELNFTSDDTDIRVYSGIAKYCGFSSFKEDVDTVVYILLDDYFPHPNETVIDTTKAIQVNTTSSSVDTIDDINGIRGYLTFSLTAPSNPNKTGYAFVNKNNEELIFAVQEPVSTGVFTDTIFYVPNTKVGGYVDLSPTKVDINEPAQTIREREQIQLTTTLTPYYAESEINWSIDNEDHFTIDQNGLLTALDANAESSTTVTAQAIENGINNTVVISSTPLIDSITFGESNVITYVGWTETPGGFVEAPESQQLSYTLSPAGAFDDLTWSSSDDNIVSVDENGLITAGSTPGTADIILSSETTTVPFTINIGGFDRTIYMPLQEKLSVTNRIRAYQIDIQQEDFDIELNTSSQLTYTILPSNAYDDVVFSELEDLSDIFDVTAEGLVTANVVNPVATDDLLVQIISSTASLDDVITITAVRPEPTSVTLAATVNPMVKGSTNQMLYTIEPHYAKQEVTWFEPSVYFSIDDNGLLTSDSEASSLTPYTTVYVKSATSPLVEDSLKINTTAQPPTGISLISTGTEIEVDKSLLFNYILTPEYSDNSLVTWSSSNEDFTISTTLGSSIYLNAPSTIQTTELTVDSGFGHNETITVTSTPTSIDRVILDDTVFEENRLGSKWMPPYSTKQLSYTVEPANASGDIYWYVSSPSVLSIDQNGLVTSSGEGVDTIFIKDLDTNTSDLVTVYTSYDNPDSINISGLSNMSIYTHQYLDITATPVSGSPDVTWSIVAGSSYAVIDQDGKITTNAAGTVTVRATSNYPGSNLSDTFTITITGTTGGTGCLDRNTLIPMWDGSYRRIRSIKPGDVVVGYTFDGMVDENTDGWQEWITDDISSGRRVPATVIEAKADWYKEYYLINNDLKITKKHPMFIKQDNVWGWVEAPYVNIGDYMVNELGQEVEIETLEFIEERLDVITMNVEEVDTYFAGNNSVLVHNIADLAFEKN